MEVRARTQFQYSLLDVHERQNQGDGLYAPPPTPLPSIPSISPSTFTHSPLKLPPPHHHTVVHIQEFSVFCLFCSILSQTISPLPAPDLSACSIYEYVSILLGSFIYSLASTYK